MISEKDIEHIVFDFYQKALNDFLIGYQFQKIEDFPKHVSKIAAFWKNQLYPEHYPPVANIRFRAKHLPLNLHLGELGRWIVLFYETLDSWNTNNNHKHSNEINRWKEKIENLKLMLLSHPLMFRTNDQK